MVQTNKEEDIVFNDDLHVHYSSYCADRNILPITKSTLGMTLLRLFPDCGLGRRHKGNRQTNKYKSLKFQRLDERVNHLDLNLPEYCESNISEGIFSLIIPTKETCNSETVNVIYCVHMDTHTMSMKVLGKSIDVDRFGFCPDVTLDQIWVNGKVLITNHLRFCHGLEGTFPKDSSVPVQKTWNTISGTICDCTLRTHSHKCKVVLPFNSPHVNEACSNCKHDLKLLCVYKKKKEQEALNENKEDSNVKKDAIEECTCKCPKHEMCGEFNPSIFLKEEHHEKLLEVIDKLMPNAPQFKHLFKSQLRNATHKDPRQRKWDPVIISAALNLWAKSPSLYKDFRNFGLVVLPSTETLRKRKNAVRQSPGIVENNIKWMLHEANMKNIKPEARRGGLLLDEMSIQHDLQVVHRGEEWELIGAIDLGPLVNNLEQVVTRHREVKLATHALAFMFLAYGGFRWPVAYFGTNNASPHQLYFTFLQLVSKLSEYEFQVDYCMLDGSSMNRSFTSLLFPDNPRKYNFMTKNPCDLNSTISIIQDIKHCLKKIRNGILSSSTGEKPIRTLQLDGKFILWSHFQSAYDHNCRHSLKDKVKFTRNHFYPTQTEKMRNHLATDVLSSNMLQLMSSYQCSLEKSNTLDSTVKLLKHTSMLVNVFCEDFKPIESSDDSRINTLLEVMNFFIHWEKQFSTPKDIKKHLFSWQTRDDIISSITGIIEVVRKVTPLKLSVHPGRFNSDVLENFFGQIRSQNGQNQNPGLWQFGPSTNTNILTGNTVSTHRNFNSSGVGESYKGIAPPPAKIFRK